MNALKSIIQSTEKRIAQSEPGSEERKQLIAELETLEKIKKSKKNRPSADGTVAAFSNLAGIAAILSFERIGMVTTKALSFIRKI